MRILLVIERLQDNRTGSISGRQVVSRAGLDYLCDWADSVAATLRRIARFAGSVIVIKLASGDVSVAVGKDGPP